MTFRAAIDIMPLPALLDPQGKAVSSNMHNIGLANIGNVRIGKHITLEVEAANQAEAEEQVKVACEKYWPTKSWNSSNSHVEAVEAVEAVGK